MVAGGSGEVVSDSCDPMDCSTLGSSVHGISQAGTVEWVVISSSRDLPNPRIEPESLVFPALPGAFFTTSTTSEAPKW